MSSLHDRLVSAPPKFKRDVIDVPEWDCKFEVRSLSVDAKLRLGSLAGEEGSEAAVMTFLVASSVFDPDTGEKVFSEDDGDWLRAQDSAVVETIASAVLEVSGLKVKALDDPKDGSSPTLNTATSSSSPAS